MATWCALQVDTAQLRQLKTNSRDFCTNLGNKLFNTKCSMLINRFLVVGDDIDVYNFKDLMWAFVTRCRPGHDEYLFDDVPGFPLTPYMSHGGRDRTRGGKVISDCLFPMEYTDGPIFQMVDFERSFPEDIKDKVRKNWTDMGFEE